MDLKNFKKTWKVYPGQPELQQKLCQTLNISPLLAQILINRGITSIETANFFLKPTLAELPQENEFPGLFPAARLILEAIKHNSKILVYGDYDVDGITGTALLLSVLRELGGQVNYYIPHRYNEGYGLNQQAIERAAQAGYDWIITVDCGISNLEEVNLATQLGMKVIITDHHMPPEQIPAAAAIVDPKRGASSSPYYALAGVGVAFMLAEILYYLDGKLSREQLHNYLDLVALGTVTDIVPLLDTNRIFTAHGLRQLNKGRRLGLKLLHSISNSNSLINTKAIGFVLGPRLNAAGRMDDASIAVELLLADTEEEALLLAARLNELNTQRRQAGEKIKEDALLILDNLRSLQQKKVLVLKEHHWHPGIIGIVASQLAKKYSKPVALIAINDGVGRGSIRSIGGVDILTSLTTCRDLFIDFGGHREAAGFTLAEKNIDLFIERYEQAMSEAIKNEDLTPTLHIDAEMDTGELSFELLAELERLAPHGQGNPVPLFASYNLHPFDYRLVGGDAHLKVCFTDRRNRYEAIGFNMGQHINRLRAGPVNIAYTLEVNEWQGKRNLQLNLQDIQ